jgi:hypothetical protein
MFRPETRPPSALTILLSLTLLSGCATSGPSGTGLPPAISGTHTVMGRAFFPGGVMVLIDANSRDGFASGTVEYSQVESRGENTFRVSVDVRCIGLFRDGSQAVVAGPVSRVDGDLMGNVGVRDWWVVQVEEGGSEGDRILSQRHDQDRALTLCHNGPTGAVTLRAVDGDLSIH